MMFFWGYMTGMTVGVVLMAVVIRYRMRRVIEDIRRGR